MFLNELALGIWRAGVEKQFNPSADGGDQAWSGSYTKINDQ